MSAACWDSEAVNLHAQSRNDYIADWRERAFNFYSRLKNCWVAKKGAVWFNVRDELWVCNWLHFSFRVPSRSLIIKFLPAHSHHRRILSARGICRLLCIISFSKLLAGGEAGDAESCSWWKSVGWVCGAPFLEILYYNETRPGECSALISMKWMQKE